MNESFMNVLSRWRASGSILGSICVTTDHESGKVAPLGLESLLLQHPVLHRTNFGVDRTEVEIDSDDELVPSMGYHLFKPRDDSFDAQRSTKLELYLFLHSHPGSYLRHISHPFRFESQLESRLQSHGNGNPDASEQRHTFGFCLWLRQWKGRFASRPCRSLRKDSAI